MTRLLVTVATIALLGASQAYADGIGRDHGEGRGRDKSDASAQRDGRGFSPQCENCTRKPRSEITWHGGRKGGTWKGGYARDNWDCPPDQQPEPTPEPERTASAEPGASPHASNDYENGDNQTWTPYHKFGLAPSEDGGNDQRMMSAIASGSVMPNEIVSTCKGGCWRLKHGIQQSWLNWTHIGPFFGHKVARDGEVDSREGR